MLVVLHQVLIVLGLVLGVHIVLGMEVVVESACCSLGTQSLVTGLVTSGSLLPPPCVDSSVMSPSSWLLYCRTGGRAHWGC